MKSNKIVEDWVAKYGNNPEVDKILDERVEYMSDKQQTAVDWIVDQMLSEGHKEMWKDMIQQAKQMEKEQLENARPQIISNCVIKEISDEEIEKAGWDYELSQIGDGYEHHFIEGAKWYREQLKKK